MLRIVQLSDPHLLAGSHLVARGVRPNRRFARAVAQVARMEPPPDCCVITGDLVGEETPEHYAELKALVAPLPSPVHFALGNHDDRQLFWQAFGVPEDAATGDDPRHRYSFALDDNGACVRCWILDSHLPGEVAGALGEAQLRWLADGLASDAADQHLVFVHHPAVALGAAWMDAMLLRDGEQLIDVLAKSRAPVARVLFGHVHQPITATVRGVTLSSAPSTAYQFTDEEVTPKVYPGTAGYHVVSVHGATVVSTVVPVIDDDERPVIMGAGDAGA